MDVINWLTTCSAIAGAAIWANNTQNRITTLENQLKEGKNGNQKT